MKTRTKLLTIGLGAIAALNFASCQDYTEFTEGEIRQNEYNQKYDEAFIKQFGMPDPNQDWGMNEEIGYIGAFSSLATRAAGNAEVLVNRNQWTEFDNNSKHDYVMPNYGTNTPTIQVPDYRTSALAHDIQIPGWPHLNGLYYAANGNTLDPDYKSGENVTTGMIPAGDVTPYEIQYVSAWFRTHKNPKSNVKLHLSDFFIQNVSCDYDQVAYNPLSEPYQDGWPETGRNGANMATKEEAMAHTAWDGSSYIKDNNLTEAISYDLDYLGFLDMEGNWTHVNNFNRGNSNFSPEDNNSNPNREIKYIKSSGTEDFSCRPSWCTNTDTIKSWVLVRLTWTETVKHTNSPYTQGTKIPREGYYLAFDFHGQKQGSNGMQVVQRDGYYSNWIVKITPGHFNPEGNSRRIFCEDLGGSFDFDFNDAVVDVAFEQKSTAEGTKYEPIISVQAAGGTMPIYVEKHNSSNYELHNMLNAPVTTPVNVGGATHAPAIYRGDLVDSDKPGAIKICVQNTKNNTHYQIAGTDPDPEPNEDERSELLDEEGKPYNPKDITLEGTSYYDNTKMAPRAFSAPTTVKWLKELKNIESAYQDFPKWVQTKTWTTPGSGAYWFENVTDGENLLYAYSVDATGGPDKTGDGSEKTPISWVDLIPADEDDARSTVSAVNADSYMKLNAYKGKDPIVNELAKMGDNDRITFIVILSSDDLYIENGAPLQGILAPANISGTTMTNKGTSFTVADLDRFNTASYVPTNHDFCSTPATCTGVTGHVNTYTLQFSFTKADLIAMNKDADGNETGKDIFQDYLLLYLKVGSNSAGETGKTLGVNHGVTVQKWYVHY